MQIQPHHAGRRGREALGRRGPVSRIVFLVCLALFAAVSIFVAVYVGSALKMKNDVDRILSSSQNMANAALGCEGDVSLSDSARELVDSTQSLRHELGASKWTWLADRTGYSSDLAAAREMLDSVGTLVDGPFTDMTNLAQRLQGLEMVDGTVDVSPLMEMPGIVEQTHTDIAQQVAELDAIPTPRIQKVAEVLATEKVALQKVDTMIAEYDDLVNLMPQLLGQDGERTYLVLVQNPAELRSAGGMVGNAAAVTADNGKVTIGDFKSVIDWKIPDAAMDDQVEQERQVFGTTFDQYAQTTVIDPEFKRVAALNTYLFKHQDGNADKNVAGVLALDPVFLQSMLGATGNVTLSDGTVLDGTTTVPFFLSDLYTNYPNFEEQNQYTSEAAHEIMTHVLDGANASNASGLLKAIRETTADGHFKLSMASEDEQNALIGTGLIDDKAGGELSADNAVPEVGVYLSELQQGKQDWYLRTTTTVTKTCGESTAQQQAVMSGVLDDRVTAAVQNTALGQYQETQLGDEYTVTFTMKNTLTEAQANALPDFVTGNGDEQVEVRGGMKYRVVLTAPFGGEITSVQADADKWGANTASLYDRQFVTLDQQWIKPGEERTIAFTVRVNTAATSPLNVVTTPIVNADGIETGSNGQVTDECPAEKRGGQSGDVQGGQDTINPNAGQTNQVNPGQTGEQQPQDSNAQQGQPQSGASDSNSHGSSSVGSGTGAGSTGKDPSKGLDSLDQLRQSLSCPVDLRKLSSAV